jgi:peptide/nickel transport system permease protein
VTARFAVSAVARIAAAVIGVAVIAHLLVAASPGRPGERAARAAGVLPPDDSQIASGVREQLIAELEARHGLDRPLSRRIAGAVARMLVGDLGRSWRDDRPVASIAARTGARTVPLIAIALGLAIAAGFLIAGLAVRRRGAPAAVAAVAIDVALVTPPVWLALLLLALGGGHLETVLAVISLAVLPAAVIARHARAVLERAIAAPWATAARARGVSEARLISRYGRRELGAELGPMLAPLAGYLLGAAMVVEVVFGIRGLGAELADASSRGDAPVVVGLSVACALIVAVAGVAGQLLQRRCDPRVAEELG